MRVRPTLRVWQALSSTVRAARRGRADRRPGDDGGRPPVAHLVADLDVVECASLVASSTAWRERHRAARRNAG